MKKKTWIILGALAIAAGIGAVIGKVIYDKHRVELLEDELYEDESLFEE